jgi:hypothetical protein
LADAGRAGGDPRGRRDPAAAGGRRPELRAGTTTPVASLGLAQTSFVIATIIPMSTHTTIATCIQIHVGDMTTQA